MSTGLESSSGEVEDENKFTTLIPMDGSADASGSFECGRQVGYDYKVFKLPNNFTCDKCTLQFEWALPNGQIHQCTDFLMQRGTQIEACSGKCQNMGVCVNGNCKCRSSFYGEFCQYQSNLVQIHSFSRQSDLLYSLLHPLSIPSRSPDLHCLPLKR